MKWGNPYLIEKLRIRWEDIWNLLAHCLPNSRLSVVNVVGSFLPFRMPTTELNFFFFLTKSFIFPPYTFRKLGWEEGSWDRPEDYIQTEEFQISKTKFTDNTLFPSALGPRAVPAEMRQAPGWLMSSAEASCWSSGACYLHAYSWWRWTWSRSRFAWRFWPCAAWPLAPHSLGSWCNTAALAELNFLKKFIYLFIFGYAGSSLLHKFFFSFSMWELRSSCGARASPCGGFSCCGAWAPGHVGSSTCGVWTQ